MLNPIVSTCSLVKSMMKSTSSLVNTLFPPWCVVLLTSYRAWRFLRTALQLFHSASCEAIQWSTVQVYTLRWNLWLGFYPCISPLKKHECLHWNGPFGHILWALSHFNLFGGLEHEFNDFPYIGNFIIPTDELIFFQRGRYTTNQCNYAWWWLMMFMVTLWKILSKVE